jgi:hypothetical protein
VTRNFSRAACIHRVGELDMNTVLCGETCPEMSSGKTNNKMEKRIVRICRIFFGIVHWEDQEQDGKTDRKN